MRPLKSFTVRHVGIRLKVRVLASPAEVALAYARHPHAKHDTVQLGHPPASFFASIVSAVSKYTGVIVLSPSARLNEYVPHEVTHAVWYYFEGDIANDDEEEEFATAIGILTRKILDEINTLTFV